MRQKNFKIVSLLTVFTIVLNVLSAVVMLQPAKAVTTASVTQSRMAASATDVTYTFALTSDAPASAVEITFPVAFTGTPATATTDCSATGNVITCTTLQTSVVVTGVTNPATVGSYDIAVNFTGDDDVTINAAIVDSDTVNVNGYINTSLTFDLDTSTIDEDCDPDSCLAHSGATGPASNYTVDLGNLTTAVVNLSGVTDVMHADGETGLVNHIWFDLSSNAAGGVIVTYVSELGYLSRHGLAGTPDAWDIPSVADGEAIVANTPGYGIKFAAAPTYENLGEAGTIAQRVDCTDVDSTYCAMPTSAAQLLGVDTSVQDLRAQLTVAAAVDGTMPAGTYVDQLTFIATGTF